MGYCYREEPDGGWDSGWRFTAGDESDEYMDDPNNAGIYKLNTICNDDPDIIPLLNTPAPCAFERDENGVFQQIKDWKPEQDEEDPDMDILKQCQKWHEEDKHQKSLTHWRQSLPRSVPRKWIWSWPALQQSGGLQRAGGKEAASPGTGTDAVP